MFLDTSVLGVGGDHAVCPFFVLCGYCVTLILILGRKIVLL